MLKKTKKIKEFIEVLNSYPYYNCTCAICHAMDFDQIANVDRYGFRYKPGICKNCGNVQQIEYYKPEILNKFYTDYYSSIYRSEMKLEQTYERQQRKGKEILKYCEDVVPSEGKVLDIGCSAGGVLSIFKDAGYQAVGCDYDEAYLDFGRAKGLDLCSGGVDQIPACSSYDLIILRHVLEHITNPADYLKQIKNLLSPQGKIYIEVPSIENVCDGGYNYNLNTYFQNAHFIHFTQKTMKNLMSLTGFKMVKINRYIKVIVKSSNDDLSNTIDHDDGYDYAKKQIRLAHIRKYSVRNFVGLSKKVLIRFPLMNRLRNMLKG